MLLVPPRHATPDTSQMLLAVVKNYFLIFPASIFQLLVFPFFRSLANHHGNHQFQPQGEYLKVEINFFAYSTLLLLLLLTWRCSKKQQQHKFAFYPFNTSSHRVTPH